DKLFPGCCCILPTHLSVIATLGPAKRGNAAARRSSSRFSFILSIMACFKHIKAYQTDGEDGAYDHERDHSSAYPEPALPEPQAQGQGASHPIVSAQAYRHANAVTGTRNTGRGKSYFPWPSFRTLPTRTV